MKLTRDDVVAIFRAWQRDYLFDTEEYDDQAIHTPDYGERCADHFIKLYEANVG